ncbi:MAG: glycosyltransferase [Caldiserica bacterium]|jgi:UDP-D-galactose:(glucosyl)LPS alpha-1,6-D-galactosyltransferase|nr:glycosyltransferase [Caldisericota bacterium]MDH7562179.1 glycosyltransferase [Caldisericota bacterium]
MKISIYTEHPLTVYGGLEKVLALTYKCLSQKGHTVRIVVIAPFKELVSPTIDWFKGIPVNRFGMKPERFLRLMCWLRLLFKKKNKTIIQAFRGDFRGNGIPDLAMVTDPELIPEFSEVIKQTGAKTKIFYWDHGLIPGTSYWLSRNGWKTNSRLFIFYFLFSQILKKVLPLADGVLAISTGIQKMSSRFKVVEKVHVVFNPIEIPHDKFNRPPMTPRFLYVGRLSDFDKNISFLLTGLSRIKDEEWFLDIIGAGPDEEKLKTLSFRLGLENKVRWLGAYPDPFSKVQDCTVLLLTSRSEGFPVVLAEANAHGIPVISSNCISGPEDIVIEGVNGYLYPEGNLEAFVDILRKVIKGELKFASPEEIAKTAERFSPEAFYERLKNALGL